MGGFAPEEQHVLMITDRRRKFGAGRKSAAQWNSGRMPYYATIPASVSMRFALAGRRWHFGSSDERLIRLLDF